MYFNFFWLPRTYSLKNALQLFFFNRLPGVEVETKRARKDHRVLLKFGSNRCELYFDLTQQDNTEPVELSWSISSIAADPITPCPHRPREPWLHHEGMWCHPYSLLDIKRPTFPLDGSTTRRMRLANVDFPAPVRPTRPTCIINSLIFTLRSTVN